MCRERERSFRWRSGVVSRTMCLRSGNSSSSSRCCHLPAAATIGCANVRCTSAACLTTGSSISTRALSSIGRHGMIVPRWSRYAHVATRWREDSVHARLARVLRAMTRLVPARPCGAPAGGVTRSSPRTSSCFSSVCGSAKNSSTVIMRGVGATSVHRAAAYFRPSHPGPRRTMPGLAPVYLPFSNTTTPLTST